MMNEQWYKLSEWDEILQVLYKLEGGWCTPPPRPVTFGLGGPLGEPKQWYKCEIITGYCYVYILLLLLVYICACTFLRCYRSSVNKDLYIIKRISRPADKSCSQQQQQSILVSPVMLVSATKEPSQCVPTDWRCHKLSGLVWKQRRRRRRRSGEY